MLEDGRVVLPPLRALMLSEVSGEGLFAVIGPDNENIGDREKLLEILRLPGITVKAVNGWRGQLLGG